MAFKQVSNSVNQYWPAKASERKAGDSVIGVYKGSNERTNPDGTQSKLYMLETKDGNVAVNSFSTIDTAMAQIPEGSTVKIVFQGKERSSRTGREYNNFQVFVDDGNGNTESETTEDLGF